MDLQSIIEISLRNPSILAYDFGRVTMTIHHRFPNQEEITPFVDVIMPSFSLLHSTERQTMRMIAKPLDPFMALQVMSRWTKGEDVGHFIVDGKDFHFEGYDDASLTVRY
jgi:hypothetical protein